MTFNSLKTRKMVKLIEVNKCLTEVNRVLKPQNDEQIPSALNENPSHRQTVAEPKKISRVK